MGVRFKISALWIAMLLLFAYGDIFGFFAPGQIEEVIGGEFVVPTGCEPVSPP